MKVFISHSSKDRELVQRLVELLRVSLNLAAGDIRCTSLEGYRQRAGADTDAAIRAEIEEAQVMVAVISKRSLKSLYVVFELGARWATKKSLFPVLAPWSDSSILGRPLSALNTLRCDSAGDLQQLVSDIGTQLNVKPDTAAAYQRYIEAICALPRPSETPGRPRSNSDAVVYQVNDREIGFDFKGHGELIWKHIDGRDQPIGDRGTGRLVFEAGGTLNIERWNTDGRFQVWLQTYVFGGAETTKIPSDNLRPGSRRLRISCDARVVRGQHTLQFILKNEISNQWLANHEFEIKADAWVPIKCELHVPFSEECRLRIDDLKVSVAPSSLQIRNFLLAERSP
jgi:hypothetical protein